MIINALSNIVTAIDTNAKFGQIIGKGAAEYGMTTVMLADEISSKIDEMDTALAIKSANWYFAANDYAVEIAHIYGVSVEIAAAVIAAVSPRMPWKRNKTVAAQLLASLGDVAELSAIDAAKAMGLGLSANIAMAIKIARGADISETLSGIKRRSFYNNIVAPNSDCDSVTVDTWMLMTYCNITGKDKKEALKFITANEKALSGTGVGYFLIADAVRIVADRMNLKPHQIQALYWVSQAGDYNGSATYIS